MPAQTPGPTEDLRRATDAIRREYDRRKFRPKASPGLFQSRLNHYEALFGALRLLPLADRRILDLGCANGSWLDICCRRWGARDENCVGVDLRADLLASWGREHPDSRITLLCQPAHELDCPDGSFDVVHHSMMLSSIVSRPLRERVAAVMWRLARPGGAIVSFDFWINPLNRHTLGIRRRELRRLFPRARFAFERTIMLAPPLCRLLKFFGPGLALALERLRLMNTHYLVALMKENG